MLSREVPQSLQSEGKRTEKILCRRTRKGARATARCRARRSRRVRVSVSQLLKTTSNSSMRHAVRAAGSPVTGAGGSGKRWLTLSPVPRHRDSSVYVVGETGAMLDEVPAGGFINNSLMRETFERLLARERNDCPPRRVCLQHSKSVAAQDLPRVTPTAKQMPPFGL